MNQVINQPNFIKNADWEDNNIDRQIEETFFLPESEKMIEKTYILSKEDIGERIDKVATKVFAEFSREQIKYWLNSGELTVNGTIQKPKYRLKAGDSLQLIATLPEQQTDIPENISLDIIYEDDSVIVINKPMGLVVHAGAGHKTGTLVNGLLYHYPESRVLPRAGLVHRIDKDTTGLLVIAKDSQSQLHLINQLKDKSVYRHYQALVLANPEELNNYRCINAPIARHLTQRTKMAVVSTGKPAITHIDKILAICEGLSLVHLRLETGRTHQIRVHMAHIGYPLLGDPVYGSPQKAAVLLKQRNNQQKAMIEIFNRQALHAYELGFIHPKTQQMIKVQAPLAEDMQNLIDILTV